MLLFVIINIFCDFLMFSSLKYVTIYEIMVMSFMGMETKHFERFLEKVSGWCAGK